MPVTDTWLNWARSIPNGPLIVLGLPAGPQAAGKPHYYFPPDKLATVYKVTNFLATSVPSHILQEMNLGFQYMRIHIFWSNI